jgi:type II secretory ATPase GspE/PulE/Tfp pilus assembly ATPase PilB-like protein
MHCESCRELMLAYMKQELEGVRLAEFEEHVAQCVACAGELEGARKVLGLVEAADQPPVWKLLEDILATTLREGASDIHLEPSAAGGCVRLRVDGVLHEIIALAPGQLDALITRVKLLAAMNVAERRIPQDGRFVLEHEGSPTDLRVSTVPGALGERMVLRVLARSSVRLSLDRMGLSAAHRTTIEGLLHRPWGLILCTGPTGSGKTTLMYAMLTSLVHPKISVMSVEDPVEFILDGVTQVQVNSRLGADFATTMRSVMRQDPDVIMCGEIRDRATLEMAIGPAVTGHLVLSQLHTPDAATALRRMANVGAERFLIADALLGVTAQRLLRRLCPDCCRAHAPTEEEARWLLANGVTTVPAQTYEAVGCENCRGTGHRGRIGVYEVLVVDEELKAAIDREPDLAVLEELARSKVVPLREDAADKVAQGLVDYAEARRVTGYTAP